MYFATKPLNCFSDFITTYFSECKRSFPKINAIAGKWEFEDLIPGMSDFDSRFICAENMSVQECVTFR